MDLLSLLLGTMTSDSTLDALSTKSGASSAMTRKLLILAIPLLLKALTNNAQSPSGASSLLGALSQHTNTDTLQHQIELADPSDGQAIIGHILGGNTQNAVNQLSLQSGMSGDQVSSTLNYLAPALLSGLSAANSSASQNNGVADLSSLSSMFGAPADLSNTSASSASDSFSLISSILGGNKPKPSSSPLGLLGALFGRKKKKEEAQDLGSIDGSALLSLLMNAR